MSVKNVEQRAYILELRDKNKASYNSIATALGISGQRVRELYFNEKRGQAHTLEWSGGLSGRAISVLHKMNLNNKEELLSAINAGMLNGGKGVGVKTFREICNHAGLGKTGGTR